MGEFNEAQVAAIRHKKGPMLVLAGAGSGKTTVLTYRIKNLIMNREVNPKEHFSAYIYKGSSKKKWKNVSML
ncbi:MAG: UvrD-helicase domain-containing protein [Anaerostipes hadrus]